MQYLGVDLFARAECFNPLPESGAVGLSCCCHRWYKSILPTSVKKDRGAMSLPEIEQHRVSKLFNSFIVKRVPPHARDQVKLVCKVIGNRVTLSECRPYYNDPSAWSEMPIAQFEYDEAAKVWSLYAYNRNDRRNLYSKGPLERLIQEVDKDITGIFWG